MAEGTSSGNAAGSSASAGAAGNSDRAANSNAASGAAEGNIASAATQDSETKTTPESGESKATPEKESKQPVESNQEPEEDSDKQPEKTEKPTETEEKPKHKYADRLSKAFPDRKFESDNDYDSAMDEYVGDLEGYRERGTKMNQKLISLFEAEPQVGDVVRDMVNGATFREALARHISADDLTAIEGDPDYEGWNKNKQAREESANKRKKYQEEFNSNLEFSGKAIAEFATENNMNEEDAGAFLSKFDAMLADINSGKITKETLIAIKKAFDYDSDLETAKQQGEVAGRNKKIVAEKETTPQGDGLPRPTNSSETPNDKKPTQHYIDGLLERTKRKQVF